MKKALFISIILLAAFVVLSCGSKPAAKADDSGRAVSGGVPQFVRDAVRNAPEDALIGVGTARSATLSASRTNASTRARAEISRSLNSMISDMIVDYTAGSEVDHSAVLSFQENITTALSRSTLVGSVVVDEDQDKDGNYWVVIMIGKNSAANEINQAAAAAKLNIPAMAAFNAMDRMDSAFDRQLKQEVGFQGD